MAETVNNYLFLDLDEEITLRDPLTQARRRIKGNEPDPRTPGMTELRDLIDVLTEGEFKGKVVGQFAIGVVRGHIADSTGPTGLYGGIEAVDDPRTILAIGFFRPDVLRKNWNEKKVGPKFQKVMKKVIDSIA